MRGVWELGEIADVPPEAVDEKELLERDWNGRPDPVDLRDDDERR